MDLYEHHAPAAGGLPDLIHCGRIASMSDQGHDRDANQAAHRTLQVVIGMSDELPAKNPAAVALGRLGGRKGGKARAAALSQDRRSEIARTAAQARWARANAD